MIKRKETIAEVEKKLCYMRCFEDCLNLLKTTKLFPRALCYEPLETKYTGYFLTNSLNDNHDTNLYLFNNPIDNYETYERKISKFKRLSNDDDFYFVDQNSFVSFSTNNFVILNDLGHWIQIKSLTQKATDNTIYSNVKHKSIKWLLKYSSDPRIPKIKFVEDPTHHSKIKAWLSYAENSYSLIRDDKSMNEYFNPNYQLMDEINRVPDKWSFEHDEELAGFLSNNLNIDLPGSMKNIVKMITLVTQRTPDDVDNLLSLDKRLYWESEYFSGSGDENSNKIKINFKPNIMIRKLFMTISKKDRNFMPKEVNVFGGNSIDDLIELNQVKICPDEDGDILILENCNEAYDFMEIRIESRNGQSCRVRGLKAFTQFDDEEYIYNGIFDRSVIDKSFTRIGSYSPTFLYFRSKLLLRFIHIFDLCIDAMVPSWALGKHFEKSIQSIKQLLVLSAKRLNLVEKLISKMPSSEIYPPSLYINRHLAAQYCENPTNDLDYHNTVFMEVFKQIKTEPSTYNFRWEKDVEQWWECKFVGEGIIDQGGGFRDSLSDIAEELCPTSAPNKQLPLKFFIRAPNQHQSDLNTYKDTFVLNPSCNEYDKYEFIGKLMGACFRTKECLALYLAPFVWKKISGESISWKRDFATVDAAEVKILDTIEKMDEDEYNSKFLNEKTWTCILSDGSCYELKPNGTDEYVSYDDRLKYVELVKKARMSESDKQLAALKSGLESVVSNHILSLLTWSEIEYKVCGSPEITLENLKMSIEYDNLSPSSTRVKYFWEAMSTFTNDERSKFVRFVTGRKRLPVKIFFCLSDQPPTSFPDASTCNCTLYFPNYPNAKVTEEKLKYAIYNCTAIDTDVTSYDD